MTHLRALQSSASCLYGVYLLPTEVFAECGVKALDPDLDHSALSQVGGAQSLHLACQQIDGAQGRC